MSRVTIDFGIDLGTTNSAVAVRNSNDVNIIKNNENGDLTPSAVWIDKAGTMHVGSTAKQRTNTDPDNSASEFKLLMGAPTKKLFKRSNRSMSPEELSAEVLKSLKHDVQTKLNESLDAVVITVPAAFELPHTEATKKAANLAGIEQCLLLSEPVAAASAYGFDTQRDRVFWLVYDFGGGTFDSALIQLYDGMMRVTEHEGDNYLGGKLIDWAIVDELLAPQLANEHNLPDFVRSNPRWRSAFARLKVAAEEAKIAVSNRDTFLVSLDSVYRDDNNEDVALEYTLKASDVERLSMPFINKSINLAHRLLTRTGLKAKDIEKLILVGGPTVMPWLREAIANAATGGLGIPLDFSIDPMTVVARGAAIYAGGKPRIVPGRSNPRPSGAYTCIFDDWKFVGAESEPLVRGKITAPGGATMNGLSLIFENSDMRPAWRSGKLPVAENGAFLADLVAVPKVQNRYKLDLIDQHGNTLNIVTEPESLVYTIGNLPPANLPHQIGIELENDKVGVLLERNAPLPAQNRRTFKISRELQRGQPDQRIEIAILEGNYERAKRNHHIGAIVIKSEDIKRNIPADSGIEVTIQIDESRLITTSAFIPILDQEFREVITLEFQAVDTNKIGDEFAVQRQRKEALRERAAQAQNEEAKQILDEIEREHAESHIIQNLGAAAGDPDAANQAEAAVRDLADRHDRVEALLHWPELVKVAEADINWSRDIINPRGTVDDQRNRDFFEAAIREAIRNRDARLLLQRTNELVAFTYGILERTGELQILIFQDLLKSQNKMTNPQLAAQLIELGQQAIQRKDFGALRTINEQLRNLLPPGQKPIITRPTL